MNIIEGKIIDVVGFLFSGVNVIEKGIKNGILIDFEGSFKINVLNNKVVLVISYLGFKI